MSTLPATAPQDRRRCSTQHEHLQFSTRSPGPMFFDLSVSARPRGSEQAGRGGKQNKGLSQGPRGVLSASRNGFGSTRAEGGRGPPCPTMSAAPPLPRDFFPARGRAGLPSPYRPARVSPCPPANRRGTRGSAGLTRTYATAPRRPGQAGRRSKFGGARVRRAAKPSPRTCE